MRMLAAIGGVEPCAKGEHEIKRLTNQQTSSLNLYTNKLKIFEISLLSLE